MDSYREEWEHIDERLELTDDEQDAFGLPAETRVHNVWLEIELGDGWRAAFRLVATAGEPAVGEIRVFPADSWPGRPAGEWRARVLGVHSPELEPNESFPAMGQGVTAQLLREVPFRVVQQHAREFHEFLSQQVRELCGSNAPDELLGFSTQEGPTRRRSDSWPDQRYAELAAAYVEEIEAGSRSPIAAVGERFRMRAERVRDAIHTARQRVILSAAPRQGRAGGRLTPYGESLLAPEDDKTEGGN